MFRICNSLWCLVVVWNCLQTAPNVCADDAAKRPVTPYGELYNKWKVEKEPLKRGSDGLRNLNRRYTHEFFELAKKHPDDDVWLDCLIWIGVEGQPGEDLDGMMTFVQKHAGQVKNRIQLQLFLPELIPIQSETLNPALSEIAEKHLDKGVRGVALYALAARTMQDAERQGSVEGCEAAKALLKRVIAEYPEVSSYRGTNLENAEPRLKHLDGPLALGKVAPEVQGKLLNGGEFQLSSLRGKVVVLVFSASWCGPCVKMHPIEKALIEKLPQSQFQFVEVNVDAPDDLTEVQKTMKEEGLAWDVVTDGPEGPLTVAWDVTAYPTFYVLDQQLRIRHHSTGFLGEKLGQWVEPILKEAGPKP
ncbi:MAG: TlpA family protein disulfide reductase [Planctomycetota bacterium]|nr:MAG: TlpA family protein disulfide reductase [Planctomycetota bacterium]